MTVRLCQPDSRRSPSVVGSRRSRDVATAWTEGVAPSSDLGLEVPGLGRTSAQPAPGITPQAKCSPAHPTRASRAASTAGRDAGRGPARRARTGRTWWAATTRAGPAVGPALRPDDDDQPEIRQLVLGQADRRPELLVDLLEPSPRGSSRRTRSRATPPGRASAPPAPQCRAAVGGQLQGNEVGGRRRRPAGRAPPAGRTSPASRAPRPRGARRSPPRRRPSSIRRTVGGRKSSRASRKRRLAGALGEAGDDRAAAGPRRAARRARRARRRGRRRRSARRSSAAAARSQPAARQCGRPSAR